MTDDNIMCVLGRLEVGVADMREVQRRQQKQLDEQNDTLRSLKTDYDRFRGAGSLVLFSVGTLGVYFSDTIKAWLNKLFH